MSELIAKWLRRDTPQQPLPTWRILCDAIATVADRTAAEKIASDKGFDITQTGIIIIMIFIMYVLLAYYIVICIIKLNHQYKLYDIL